ncbi:MAG: hypothetical protein ACFFEE_08605 [Candidatus Thorarchaeota archaeon]
MQTSVNLNNLLKDLVSFAYPELQKRVVVASWGKTSSFGQVRWNDDSQEISIKIDKCVRGWHPAGITGLLSHELSHPTQRGSGLKELKTDEDVIKRGLGPYLAIDRILAGKYEDHIMRRGKDRYLGYRSIRGHLTPQETRDLDRLMSDTQLKPVASGKRTLLHDSVFYEKGGTTTISVEGHKFTLPHGFDDPDIKMVIRGGTVYVYADEILVGQYEEDVL